MGAQLVRMKYSHWHAHPNTRTHTLCGLLRSSTRTLQKHWLVMTCYDRKLPNTLRWSVAIFRVASWEIHWKYLGINWLREAPMGCFYGTSCVVFLNTALVHSVTIRDEKFFISCNSYIRGVYIYNYMFYLNLFRTGSKDVKGCLLLTWQLGPSNHIQPTINDQQFANWTITIFIIQLNTQYYIAHCQSTGGHVLFFKTKIAFRNCVIKIGVWLKIKDLGYF